MVAAGGTGGGSILFQLAEYGILGIAVILLVLALLRLHRQNGHLYDRLIEKSERDSEKYHELGSAMNEALQELAGLVYDLISGMSERS